MYPLGKCPLAPGELNVEESGGMDWWVRDPELGLGRRSGNEGDACDSVWHRRGRC